MKCLVINHAGLLLRRLQSYILKVNALKPPFQANHMNKAFKYICDCEMWNFFTRENSSEIYFLANFVLKLCNLFVFNYKNSSV